MAMSTPPSEDELKTMPPDQQEQMGKSMVEAERRLAAMSPEERSAMKAKMTSVLEIKGRDAQGRCQTTTIAIPGQRLDCTLDKSGLQRVSEYVRLAATAKQIQIESTSHVVDGKMVTEQIDTIDGKKMANPWTAALNNGQCKMIEADADLGGVSINEMNRMSHFEINLSEHGKPVDGHIQILNSADGGVLFDKDVKASLEARKINLKPGSFDIKVVSANPQLPPVWFRGVKLGEANVFKKHVEFYAISGTLNLLVNVNGKPSKGAAIYVVDPETKEWIGQWSRWQKASFTFVPASIELPETLTGRYLVSVAPVPTGLSVPSNATYKDFLLTIKNGETVEKTVDFGEGPVVASPAQMAHRESTAEVTPKPKSPVADADGMEQNTDRPGVDIRHFVPPSADPTLCQQACREDTQCKAWTYVKPNTVQGPSPNCWLKQTAPPARRNSCCVSGARQTGKQ